MSEESVTDRRWVLVLVLALVAVGSGVWYGRGVRGAGNVPVAVSPMETATVTSISTPPSTIVVHVSGWVVHPGVVTVPSTARVGDAVAAAGGARPGARLGGINLAQPLGDGHQIVVPGPLTPVLPGVADPTASTDDSVHLNTAGIDDLERLPGVGPVLAERILAYRESHGPFGSVEDLLDVAGIGEAKLDAIRDLAVVP